MKRCTFGASHASHTSAPHAIVAAIFVRGRHVTRIMTQSRCLDVQLGELRRAHRRSGASVIRSVPFCVLGKGMTSRRSRAPREQHREPVHAERDAAVRRRAELERVEQEAELAAAPPRREMPSARKTFACTSGSWRRIEPPPISKPLSTRS